MESYRLFFQFLQKFAHLTEDEFNDVIKPSLTIRQFKKKTIITPTGEVENYLNFISKGLVRKYFVRDKEEINIQLSTERQLIHAHESFHCRKPSEYFIEAIEQATLVSITYDDLEKIYSTDVKYERMGRLIITYFMILKDRWQMSMIKLNPRDRFLEFVKKNPELLQRVPQKYLASFLNIQPETFSRFKHMLKEKV